LEIRNCVVCAFGRLADAWGSLFDEQIKCAALRLLQCGDLPEDFDLNLRLTIENGPEQSFIRGSSTAGFGINGRRGRRPPEQTQAFSIAGGAAASRT